MEIFTISCNVNCNVNYSFSVLIKSIYARAPNPDLGSLFFFF